MFCSTMRRSPAWKMSRSLLGLSLSRLSSFRFERSRSSLTYQIVTRAKRTTHDEQLRLLLLLLSLTLRLT